MIGQLRSIPGLEKYEKKFESIYKIVSPHTKTAVGNAKALTKHNLDSKSDNPATKMHELVNYMTSLADKKIGN